MQTNTVTASRWGSYKGKDKEPKYKIGGGAVKRLDERVTEL